MSRNPRSASRPPGSAGYSPRTNSRLRSFEESAAGSGVNVNALLSLNRYAVLRLRPRLRNVYDGLKKVRVAGNMRPRKSRLLYIAPLALLGMLLFVAIGGAVVMLLWNWLLPPLVGWSEIGLWQALGLLALCRLLFGGLRGCGRPGRRKGVRCGPCGAKSY